VVYCSHTWEVDLKALLSVADLSSEDIHSLLSDAVDMKAEGWSSLLDKKILALVFEKPSLRTRVSFEVAMRQLGGHTIYLSSAEVGLGQREAVSDIAQVLGRYVDAIAARTFSHQTLEMLADYSRVPVINALSDWEHPCQALADLLTIYEKKGELNRLTLAFIGDGNNVAHSLLLAASLTGMSFRIASPAGYAVQDRILHLAQDYAASSGAEIFCTDEPNQAVSGADVVYTDVWTSMGQEDAILMHPLPAHYGEEVLEGILGSPQSVVFDQAGNRMHLQKALLARMLGGLEIPLTGYR
jgi:ornithine carbamoyltransferase